jgi:hypothetical protein
MMMPSIGERAAEFEALNTPDATKEELHAALQAATTFIRSLQVFDLPSPWLRTGAPYRTALSQLAPSTEDEIWDNPLAGPMPGEPYADNRFTLPPLHGNNDNLILVSDQAYG